MASEVSLPTNLRFPVTITKLLVEPGGKIGRSTKLLEYSYKYKAPDEKKAETRYGTWESHLEGRLELWNIDPGDVITRDYGPVMLVQEPCKHGLQYGGLCALCGEDMTNVDYMSTAESARATIRMDHRGGGPLLSEEEAAKIERETRENLLKLRKLSLLVDLDQTILHTTIDPTVGEWLHDKREAEKNPNFPVEDINPNWDALNDVTPFQVPDDPEQRWHYVKPRPGLKKFMDTLSTKFEMHVYTMGSRSYADIICAIFDPESKWFGKRVLTRSESGSIRHKSLERLFPSDQSMVIVIDDRADVWNWSPHLVKVIPYEFFAGTGDINSATLPSQTNNEVFVPLSQATPSAVDEEQQRRQEQEEEEALKIEKAKKNEALKDHPLAKAQEALDQVEVKDTKQKIVPKKRSKTPPGEPPGPSNPSKRQSQHRAILHNNDFELERVQNILLEIHKTFYDLIEARENMTIKGKGKGKATLPRGFDPLAPPDVSDIIKSRMANTFHGLHFVFSGLIPLDEVPEKNHIWRTSRAFGAVCHRDMNPQITHLVAANTGTKKVDQARRANIPVVSIKWHTDSVAKWERQKEGPYLLVKPLSNLNRVSSLANAEVTAPPSRSTTPPLPNDVEEANGPLELEGIDWDAADREVDELLAEDSDDMDAEDDEESEKDATSNRNALGERRGIKRRRSGTASVSSSTSRTNSSNSLNAESAEAQAESPTKPASKRPRIDHLPSHKRKTSLLRQEVSVSFQGEVATPPQSSITRTVSTASMESVEEDPPATQPVDQEDDEDDFLLDAFEADQSTAEQVMDSESSDGSSDSE